MKISYIFKTLSFILLFVHTSSTNAMLTKRKRSKEMKIVLKESDIAGKGIYAKEFIPANSIIFEMKYIREVTKDKPLDPEKGEAYDHQIYLPDGSIFLVAEPGCYFNHSCDPNAFIFSADKTYFVIAKRDIKKDEEVAVDYELHAIDGDTWECKCGASNCRGLHKWDFFSLPDEVQLKSLPFLDPWFAQVHTKRIKKLLQRQLKN